MRQLWITGSGKRSKAGSRGSAGGSKRAQASVETLSIFALLFIILVPVLFVFYTYASSTHEQMRRNQIAVIGNDIVAGAETVHYLGEPSRILLIETFPSGIADLQADKTELWFTLADGGEMVFFTSSEEIQLEGTFKEEQYTQGEKNILLQAGKGAVNISIS